MLLLKLDKLDERFKKPIITIGNFDGVHIGHQVILRKIVEKAGEIGGTSVVLTFEPHPLKVIAPEKSPKLLTTFSEKTRLIEDMGVDVIVTARFTKEFASMHPLEFVSDILVGKIHVNEVWVGQDYTFGKNRSGDVRHLEELSKQFSFSVYVVGPVRLGNTVVSSSKIRNYLLSGRVKNANALLGRYYSIQGIVITGSDRGQKLLGIPTANLMSENELIPEDGVYAVFVEFDGHSFKGVANIGCNPTFGGKKLSIEVHILAFKENIIGKTIRVKFLDRIRDEIAFSDPAMLSEQIRDDIEHAEGIFESMIPLTVERKISYHIFTGA
ncbi:MAG: bifunctional riboflavin kinase/FAD synthetase [Nitrospirota bacterium]